MNGLQDECTIFTEIDDNFRNSFETFSACVNDHKFRKPAFAIENQISQHPLEVSQNPSSSTYVNQTNFTVMFSNFFFSKSPEIFPKSLEGYPLHFSLSFLPHLTV